MDVVTISGTANRVEERAEALAIHRDFQNAGRFCRSFREFAVMPLLPVEHERRGVDTFCFPARRILRLPFGPELRRKRIVPDKAVPVINVERDRYDVLPEPR